MMVIGITGTSGSGKTLVSKIIKEKYNAEVIDADKIAKKLSMTKTKYFEKILKTFGNNILNTDNQINRKKLADIIYKDKVYKKKLDKLTNKYVVKEIKKELGKCKNNIVVLDVPLLIESKLNKKCNLVIGIIAKEDIKIKRIIERDLLEEEIVKKRLRIQPTDKFYKKHCDYIIENNDNNLEDKIEKIMYVVQGEK